MSDSESPVGGDDITNYFRVIRRQSAPTGSTFGNTNHAVPNAGMSGDAAAELAKQQRKADGRKTLPTVQPWNCSFKHRLLPSTQASLKMLLRELKAYLKVDAIRETAYLTDEHEKTEARTIRNSVLMWTERQMLVPGTEVHAMTGAVRICRHGNGNEIRAERVRHDHFMDANGTMVRITLGAVKDPAIVNQLSDLHDAQEGNVRPWGIRAARWPQTTAPLSNDHVRLDVFQGKQTGVLTVDKRLPPTLPLTR